MLEHEYTVLGGINRVKVGRYLGTLSAAVSAGVVFLLLSAVDIAAKVGLPMNVPPSVLSLVGAGVIFAVLNWLLSRYFWSWSVVGKFLKVPDLRGTWLCDGHTFKTASSPEYNWKATVTISQTWDRIRVRLKTDQSGANSSSAALVCDDADGYRLFFSYKNEPRIGEYELKAHRGFAELVFAHDRQTAEGEYFNGYGRYTFGTMKLRRA